MHMCMYTAKPNSDLCRECGNHQHSEPPPPGFLCVEPLPGLAQRACQSDKSDSSVNQKTERYIVPWPFVEMAAGHRGRPTSIPASTALLCLLAHLHLHLHLQTYTYTTVTTLNTLHYIHLWVGQWAPEGLQLLIVVPFSFCFFVSSLGTDICQVISVVPFPPLLTNTYQPVIDLSTAQEGGWEVIPVTPLRSHGAWHPEKQLQLLLLLLLPDTPKTATNLAS